jgi:hypothetical protein
MTDENDRKRVFVYQGMLPGWLGLLLAAPLLLLFFSLALTLLTGGALAALFLPLFFRYRLRRPSRPSDPSTIELDPSQYSHVEPAPRLPDDSAGR